MTKSGNCVKISMYFICSERKVMKLNYKRTILVGFAFFLISAFWQAYDNNVPKILTERFGMNQDASGIVMALDNVLALFMLPLFGIISDKCKSRLGRRTPFILIGTILAACTFMSLSFVDNAQSKKIEHVTDLESVEVREILYDYDYEKELMTPEGDEFILTDLFTREEFLSLKTFEKNEKGKDVATDDYTNYLVPARQAYINQEITSKDPSALIWFIAILFILLMSMAIFRTPAVSLMPDVTPKPLRSKGNAIINLMGTLGGSLTLGVGIVLGTGTVKNTFAPYYVYFIVIGAIMLLSLLVFMLTVKEKDFVADMEKQSKEMGIVEEDNSTAGDRKLSKPELKSLILILASVVLWYFGYNAVTSKYSVYAGQVLNLDYNTTLLVANVAALIAFIPVGIISSKIGRKKSILAGVIMLTSAFFIASFMRNGTPVIVMTLLFVLAGIAWATINVNSFPMVVELAKGSDVGKYTGFYYTASMTAQTLTPVLSGFIMKQWGMTKLFPYASIFVAGAFITMFFVKHGDAKPEQQGALEALAGADD